MKKQLLHRTAPLAVSVLALAASAALAQTQSPGNSGYWINAGSQLVWKNAAGQCWRAGYWTPAHAIMECDPDLLPKPQPVAAAPAAPIAQAPAPKPAPAPAPVPVAQKVTLAADALFDFDKAVVKPEGRRKLDDVVNGMSGVQVQMILAVGHTDSIGSAAYNQKLSMRRAEAVKAYLVGKGIPGERISIDGKGETQPVADNKTKEGRAQNRRVEVEITGTRQVRQGNPG
jgi:OOP family OmpA-OmpF porin